MGKRDAVATTGVTKKIKIDPITEKCNLVLAAIKQLADLPTNTCDMLKLTLPLCLGICQNDRHEYQQSSVGAVAKELAKVEAKLQGRIAEEESVKSSMEEKRKLDDEAVIGIKATLDTKKNMLEKQKLELFEEATAFQNAKRALRGAEEMQANRENELTKVEGKKVALEDIVQKQYQSLKEGSVEREQAPKLATELVTSLKSLLELNETLATTIPSALGKEPASRGPFDTIAVQHLEEDMEKYLMEWKTLIQNAETVKAQHVAEVNTAREAFKATQERQIASAESFTTIRKELEDTEKLLAEAKRKQPANTAACARADKKIQDARKKFDEFCQGPLTVFAELRDRNQLEVESNTWSTDANEAVEAAKEVPMELTAITA